MLVQINLLPDELRRKAKSEKSRFNLQVPKYVPYVVGVSVVVAVVISFAVIAYTGSITNSLKSAKKQLEEERTHAAKSITLLAQLPELEAKAASIVGRVTEKVTWWEILDQIARCCPSNAVLESIKVQQDTMTSFPTTLSITGYYQDDNGLEITFTRNLQASAKLSKWIDKIYPGQTTTTDDRRYFTIKCNFIQVEATETGEEKE